MPTKEGDSSIFIDRFIDLVGMSTIKLDKIDKKILQSLFLDARTKYTDIAKESDVTIDKIKQKYTKLVNSGLIMGSTVIIDPRKTGNDIIASLNIDTVFVSKIIRFLEDIDEIIFSTHTMGRYDIFAIAVCENLEKMNRLVENIKKLTIVQDLSINIWVGQYRIMPESISLEQE